MKIVLVTGGFDPIHSGHISYFQAARNLGDKLVVGINSDEWLIRKKGQPFMPWFERIKIIQALKMVDFVIEYNDGDNSSKNAIKLVRISSFTLLGLYPLAFNCAIVVMFIFLLKD